MQQQKKIADTQKQLALENTNKVRESARRAALRLAEGLVSQADTFSLAGRFLEAHRFYTEAYDQFAELEAPLTVAEIGLWSSYHQTSFPLLSFRGHSGAVRSVAIAPDSRSAISASDDNALRCWDLATGRLLRPSAAMAKKSPAPPLPRTADRRRGG